MKKVHSLKTDRERIHGILEVLMAYARLEFDGIVKNSVKNDEIDAIGLGVNMLGEELKASVLTIREKENMLREIHHRVKNNLQIVSSLLNLQVQNDSDETVRKYARESQSRIRTIALIHEMLYKSTDFKYSNFSAYIRRLTESLVSTYARPDHKIEFHIEIPDNLYFNIDQLIPLGLIVNETISNSIKYAFPNGKGNISIKAVIDRDDHLITIADDGVGLDDDFELKANRNLGMNLIWMLADQVNMSVDLKNHVGLTYELRFVRSN